MLRDYFELISSTDSKVDSDGKHQIITWPAAARTQISRGHSRSGAVVSGRWKEARWSHHLISAPVLLPASPLRCSVSSDYRRYGKFAADDQPRFPAKFPIMPAELPLGFSVCINRV